MKRQPVMGVMLAGALLTLTACADGPDTPNSGAGPTSPLVSSPAAVSSPSPSPNSSPAAPEVADDLQAVALNGVMVEVPGSWGRGDGRCDWLAEGAIHLQEPGADPDGVCGESPSVTLLPFDSEQGRSWSELALEPQMLGGLRTLTGNTCLPTAACTIPYGRVTVVPSANTALIVSSGRKQGVGLTTEIITSLRQTPVDSAPTPAAQSEGDSESPAITLNSQPDEWPSALIQGTLTSRGGCLLIGSDVAVFPYGTSWEEPNVVFPDGTKAEVGTQVRMTGGHYDLESITQEDLPIVPLATVEACADEAGATGFVWAKS